MPRPFYLVAAIVAALAVTPTPLRSAEVGLVRAQEANFRMTADDRAGRGRDAPGLAVDPRDPRHIVGVTIEMFKGDCDHHVTFDGGRTWIDGHLTAPESFPRPLCQTGGGTAMMDQSIAFASDGVVHTTFTAARPNEGRSVLVARSTDGGRTFATATVAIPGGTQGSSPSYLLPKLVIEPRPGGDRIYLVARRSMETVVVRSDDGGGTWSPPVVASAPGETAIEQTQPVVDRNGHVFVGWRTQGQVGSVLVGKSTDGGQTWTRSKAADVRGYEGNTASTFPRLAVDPRDGTLYVVYGQGPTDESRSAGRTSQDHFIHPDSEVLLVRSTDGGVTWSRPVRVSDSFPGVVTTRHPSVSVAPDGRVDVVWHDRRHGYRAPTNSHGPPIGFPNGEARLGDTYYAYSTDGGVTFSPNRRITDRTFNNDIGLDYRSGTYWSYGPVSVPVGADRILVAWMDSRHGTVDDDNQDIYLSYVDARASGSVPVRQIRSGDSNRSVAVSLSRAAFPAGPEAVLSNTFTTSPVTRVVIVNELDAALVSASAVLGRANLGPVLLSASSGLDDETRSEVARMRPIGAFVVGDEAALSSRVVDDLVAAGVRRDAIVRIAGSAPADTARRIAEAMDTRSTTDRLPVIGKPAFDAAVVVNPAAPSAPAGTALAAARRLPVLFVERDSVPRATTDALQGLAIKATLVIGGATEVSDAVARQLPSPKRLGGAELPVTAEAVTVESVQRTVATNNVFVADPAKPVEAALLGAAAGRVGGLLVLADGAAVAAAGQVAERAGLGSLIDRFVVVSSAPAPTGSAPARRGRQLPATGPSTALLLSGLVLLALGLSARRLR